MADNETNEMSSAFALGCMDKINYREFKNYLRRGGELPQGELGDSQNIIALIPTVLHIVTPREELKNQLGTRLIDIQKKINTLVIEDRRKTRIELEEKFLARNPLTKIFDVDDKRVNFSRESKIEEKEPIPPHQIKEEREIAYNPSQGTQGKPKSKSKSVSFLWVFSIILLITIAVLSYFYFNKTNDLAEENSEFHNQIVKLRADLSRTKNFVNENKQFVEFLNNPNISFIQLKGLEAKSKESGRLMISFDTGEGFLQLKNMPRIDSDKIYQLWLVSKSGTFSLGAFEITPDRKHIKFSEIPFVLKDDIKFFRISQENRDKTEKPNGKTILFGSFQKPTPSKRR